MGTAFNVSLLLQVSLYPLGLKLRDYKSQTKNELHVFIHGLSLILIT